MRLIDADALFEVLGLDQYNNAEGMTSDEEWIADAIMSVPTIEAEPVRRGKWIREPNCWYRCAVCGDHYPSIADNMKYNYCPNCGADMRGEKDG